MLTMNSKKTDELFARADEWIGKIFEKSPGLLFVRTGKRWKKVCVGLVVFSMITLLTLATIQYILYGPLRTDVSLVTLLTRKISIGTVIFSSTTGIICFIPFVVTRKE